VTGSVLGPLHLVVVAMVLHRTTTTTIAVGPVLRVTTVRAVTTIAAVARHLVTTTTAALRILIRLAHLLRHALAARLHQWMTTLLLVEIVETAEDAMQTTRTALHHHVGAAILMSLTRTAMVASLMDARQAHRLAENVVVNVVAMMAAMTVGATGDYLLLFLPPCTRSFAR